MIADGSVTRRRDPKTAYRTAGLPKCATSCGCLATPTADKVPCPRGWNSSSSTIFPSPMKFNLGIELDNSVS